MVLLVLSEIFLTLEIFQFLTLKMKNAFLHDKFRVAHMKHRLKPGEKLPVHSTEEAFDLKIIV